MIEIEQFIRVLIIIVTIWLFLLYYWFEVLYITKPIQLKRVRVSKQNFRGHNHLPTVYVVTPTYTKHTQHAELLAIGNTLRNIPNITWIVVEENIELSEKVAELLENSQVSYVHLLGR